MSKVFSEYALRRDLAKFDDDAGIADHFDLNVQPLLKPL